jgi:hypothetical protein
LFRFIKKYIFLIIELLSPDDRNRIKAKDIFTHPWVKGFEEQLKIKRNRSPERNKFDIVMRSPMKEGILHSQRSPQRAMTLKERSSERNIIPDNTTQRRQKRSETMKTPKSHKRYEK